MRRRIADLQLDVSEERMQKDRMTREKATLTDEVLALRQYVVQLETLLRNSDAANSEMRERLRNVEEVQRIPSCEIHFTDRKLGSGSYGGEITPLHVCVN